jgi:hypothetical protein
MGMPQRDEVITIYPDGTAHRHHLELRLHISESKAIPVPEHDGPLVDALDIINAFPDEFIFTNEQARALTNYIIPADKEGKG